MHDEPRRMIKLIGLMGIVLAVAGSPDVEVETNDGSRTKGRLVAISAEEVIVQQPEARTVVPAQDVRQVRTGVSPIPLSSEKLAWLTLTDGSLWVDGSRVGQVYDYRARDVNDLVTIKVVESTSASNTADITTERDDTASRGLTSLLGLQDRLLPRSVDNSSAINASSDDEYESTGTNRRTESLASTITARVIQRLPNGNLVIEGAREVIINHERQTMVLRGIVRPVDIDESNSVLSTQVSDLQVRFSGSGVLTENLRRGWFSRLINYIWPL